MSFSEGLFLIVLFCSLLLFVPAFRQLPLFYRRRS
jgi:hypothetical protein